MSNRKKLYALLLLLAAQNTFAATNFTITPYGAVPTTVGVGQSVSAYYTLTNMTNSARNGYTIQGLPTGVTQNTTPPNCSSPINLAAHASCHLQFDIAVPVSTNFALCKGASCTTATAPLNVGAASTPVVPVGPTMPKFIYVINSYNTPAAEVCALDGTTGAVQSCQDAGGASVFAGLPLLGIAVNNTNTIAYISNGDGSSSSPYTYQCQIDPVTSVFDSCSSTTVTSPVGYTPYEGMMGINSANTFVYLTDNTGRILACPIIAGIISGSCVDTGATPVATNVSSVIVNKAGTTGYIGNYNSPVGVEVCSVNGGAFSSCISKTGGSINGTPFTFQSVGGVALNTAENTIYIADDSGTTIYGCSTTANNSSAFTNCFIANTANQSYNVVLNATNTVAYLSDFSTNLYTCPILSDGSFPTCTDFTLPGATTGLALVY